MVNARTAGEVDKLALELLRKDLVAHKREIAEFKEGVRFYKSLMAPAELERGLMIGELSINATDKPRHFNLRLVIQQIAAKHALLTGSAVVKVEGIMEGKSEILSLSELLPKLSRNNFKLRFKYFQAIDVEFTLPEGFEAKKIQVRANVVKPRLAEAERQFAWVIED